MKSLFSKINEFANKYPRLTVLVAMTIVLGLVVSFWIDLAYSQTKTGPQEYLGFQKYEYPKVSREKIKDATVIDAGRIAGHDNAYLSITGYVAPNGEKVLALTLIYSDEMFPKLIGIGATDGKKMDLNHTLLALDAWEKSFKGLLVTVTKDVSPSIRLPRLNFTYSDGTIFTVALVKYEDEQYGIARVLVWEVPK